MESSEQNYAELLFDIIKDEFDDAVEAAKKQGKEVRLEASTDFGQLPVAFIAASAITNIIRMQVQHEDKSASIILTDASRCSFRLFFVPASTDNLITGFGETSKPQSKLA